MAILGKLLKTDNEYGIDFEDVYYKIDDFNINIVKGDVRIGIRGYASQEARNTDGAIGIYKKLFTFSLKDLGLDKDNLLTIIYNKLSSGEFKGMKKV